MNVKPFEEERDILVNKRAFLNNFVLPDYDFYNIKNIKSLVAKIYGINSLNTTFLSDEVLDEYQGVEKIFLIVADGFGYNRLLTHVERQEGTLSEIVSKGVLKPLTSPFPATTSTSLASIFTGLTPGEHGIAGYHMFSREYGCVINTLEMRPVYGYSSEVEIAKDLSRKIRPWISSLQEHGIKTLIATKSSIMRSGLSRVIHADQEIIPYSLESEMLLKCRKAFEQEGPLFLILYYSGIDTLEHKYGPDSEEVMSEIQSFEFLLRRFFDKISIATKKEALIMLISDHGVCETQSTSYIKDFPEVASKLQLPPVGDSRATFLFSKQGEKDNLKNAFEEELKNFRLVESNEIIESGAFGKTTDSMLIRSTVGDLTALSTGPKVLSYPYFEDDRNREQRGSHGGMTPEEVIVPLLSMKLSKI